MRLVGRQSALDRLDALRRRMVASRQAAIAAIIGMPGVGKSVLALHWAHAAAGTFDGQLYVDLHDQGRDPAPTPAAALSSFLHALGVPPNDIPAEITSQLGLYRSLSRPRRLLVVLDGALDARQVRPLLPAGASSLTLVTSRDRLASLTVRDGAESVGLAPLLPHEAVTLITEALGDHHIGSDPLYVRELARLCGNLPRALRIAAANVIDHPHWTLAEYVARPAAGDLLAELAVPGDDGASMRAALDASYAALAVPAQRLPVALAGAPHPSPRTGDTERMTRGSRRRAGARAGAEHRIMAA